MGTPKPQEYTILPSTIRISFRRLSTKRSAATPFLTSSGSWNEDEQRVDQVVLQRPVARGGAPRGLGASRRAPGSPRSRPAACPPEQLEQEHQLELQEEELPRWLRSHFQLIARSFEFGIRRQEPHEAPRRGRSGLAREESRDIGICAAEGTHRQRCGRSSPA